MSSAHRDGGAEIVRLFNHSMDVGGWGWSAQCLHPRGPVVCSAIMIACPWSRT